MAGMSEPTPAPSGPTSEARPGGAWRPRSRVAWGALGLVALSTLTLVVTLALAIVPVAGGHVGLLGGLGLMLPVQFFPVALVMAVVGVAAWWRGARATVAAAVVGAVAALVVAAWPTWVLTRYADDLDVPVSLTEALEPVLNEDAPRDGVTYATAPDGTELRLDVWRAAAVTGRRPAIVKVHGGGWATGGRGETARWNRFLSERGFDVFDIEYRLAPAAHPLDAIADVKCAIGWVARNAGSLGVDPARISVFGTSAGGHLALLAALTPGDAALPASCPVPAGTTVRSVISFYGPVDLAAAYADTGSPSTVRRDLRRYIGGAPRRRPRSYRLLSPVTHVERGAPPVLMFMGDKDRIVPPGQADRLEAAFGAVGARSEIVRLPATDHGFDVNWTGPATQIARGVLERFLARYAR